MWRVQNLGRIFREVPSKPLIWLCPLLDIGFAACPSLHALEIIVIPNLAGDTIIERRQQRQIRRASMKSIRRGCWCAMLLSLLNLLKVLILRIVLVVLLNNIVVLLLSNIILVLRRVQNLGRTVREVPSKPLLWLCPLLDIGFAACLSLHALEIIVSLLSLRLC